MATVARALFMGLIIVHHSSKRIGMRCGEEGDHAEAAAMLAQTADEEHPKNHESATIYTLYSPDPVTFR
ncbi:hypothetical protein CHIBA101_2344 [Actinomyces sp. Chiba101]|nr:hypothetical protein CHIBA101_2344 [Actinomyces sp. Chiba101]GAV95275.1 hypothetical protein ADENT20671_2059 [Actinomyces denticolens]